jgi:membrane protein DedA with SNARE-associated domain
LEAEEGTPPEPDPGSDPEPDSGPDPEPRPAPSRRTLWLLVAPLIVLVIAANVGNALWPTLLRDHPLLLIALDARNRWLVLVSAKVSAVPFFVVGFLRRVASDPLFFALGYLYGDRAVRWVERRFAPDTGLVEWLENNFSKLAPPLVFLFPGNLVCVLAGAARMKPALFAVLNVAGTVTMLAVIWVFGDVASEPVGVFTRFVERNFRLFTGLSIAATLYFFWDQRRRGKSEVTSLSEVERELGGTEPTDPDQSA